MPFERSDSGTAVLPVAHPPRRPAAVRVRPAALAGCVLLVAACKSGPETRVSVEEHFSIETAGNSARQTAAGIAITDLGEPSAAVAPPVQVQACRDGRLEFAERKVSGKKWELRGKKLKLRPKKSRPRTVRQRSTRPCIPWKGSISAS